MSRILKFKENIISYLGENEQDADLMSWMNAQPVLDRPDILRALNSLLLENFDIKPDLDREEVLAIVDEKIQEFEESILDNKLHESLFKMEMEARITDEETFGYYLDFTRQEVKTRIVSNPENQENWDLAHKIIQMEKDSGFYNPDNWKAII
ncbi:hypothetical protein EKL98_08645 [Flavobacterium bomense]|uniref:Uncharacterized protein n=1 Tax=Flavobacterium bomense TaxID=2497483 RepID=A0A432CM97_9FLAO|nr:hypothetical protein [Flavobacterium bomense]RTZ04608.1 hypothetical protein EKL98_08645 [Flavobacterium bomense]